jgi:hypothetical protein
VQDNDSNIKVAAARRRIIGYPPESIQPPFSATARHNANNRSVETWPNAVSLKRSRHRRYHAAPPTLVRRVQTILTPVSIGELIDKITILEIKAERITDAAKLANVRIELDDLLPLWQQQQTARPTLSALKDQLKAINERMWDIQDALRAKEAAQTFDESFISLARGVYGTNGERVVVKNDINRIAGSALVEEKQYQGE